MIDLDYTADISNIMQVPSRLSLVLPDFSSADNVSGMGTGSQVLISGSNKSDHLYNPYDLPVARPSLEPPPESLVLGQVEYPDIDRFSRPLCSPIGGNKENSNLSLFQFPMIILYYFISSLYSPPDDDRTLIEQAPLNVSAEDCEASPAVNLEGQLEELVVRVAALENALARQNRRELFFLILLGTYFLLKLGRSLL
ncbi:hypothetical protein EGR_02840 [Echinococcus granulosus]|uniref:Uncharacterized protein n=1 Tax=Echinococcus granulosus TaxID=6210 RepID=W6UVG2_ECHGR|nr:hypothetical protein EGR_02840 [Echinococcus granulosus]EUB62387.1 hypothetical protein EGR_02840 [Echinococcus granulosus]